MSIDDRVYRGRRGFGVPLGSFRPFPMLSLVVTGVLALWFALALLNQFRHPPLKRLMAWVRRRDRLGLLPGWGFFTADVGTTDVFVYARRRGPDGTPTGWHAVPTGRRQGVLRLVHPDRRMRVAVSNTRHWLLAHLHASDGTSGRIREGEPYRLLLRYAASTVPRETTPEGEETAGCQFLVGIRAEPGGASPIKPLLVSAFHSDDEGMASR